MNTIGGSLSAAKVGQIFGVFATRGSLLLVGDLLLDF